MTGLRHCGQRMIVIDTREAKNHTRRRRECVICHRRFTTHEVVILEEASKPSRCCKVCQIELTEANIFKKGNHICKDCKGMSSGVIHQRYQSRIDTDFRCSQPVKSRNAHNRKLPDLATLIELYEKPMGLKAIGQMYNANGEAVRQQLLKAGVTMRPPGPTVSKPRKPPKPPRQPKSVGCPDCITNHYCRGLCHTCYERARRRGELEKYQKLGRVKKTRRIKPDSN